MTARYWWEQNACKQVPVITMLTGEYVEGPVVPLDMTEDYSDRPWTCPHIGTGLVCQCVIVCRCVTEKRWAVTSSGVSISKVLSFLRPIYGDGLLRLLALMFGLYIWFKIFEAAFLK